MIGMKQKLGKIW